MSIYTNRQALRNNTTNNFNPNNAFCLCPDCPSCKHTSEEKTRFCDLNASTIITKTMGCICASCYHEKDVKRPQLYRCKTGHNHNNQIFY